MNSTVRRLLEGLVAVMALAFVGVTLYYMARDWQASSQSAAQNADRPAIVVEDVAALDVPCEPVPDPASTRFICIADADGQSALWHGTIGGGAELILTDIRLADGLWDVAWSGDGRTVLLLLRGPDEREGDVQTPGWQVLALDIVDRSLRELALAAPGAMLQRRPDGSIAFQTQTDVVIYHDGDIEQAPFGPSASVFPRTLDTIALSPTNDAHAARLLVAQSGGALRFIDRERSTETLIDRTLYRGQRTFAWSPDGRTIAYANRDDRSRRPALRLYTLEDRSRRLLWDAPMEGTIDYVTWVPDGTVLLYAFIPDRPNASIETTYYAFPLEARKPIQLWKNGYRLALASGGDIVVFRREFVDGEPVDGPGAWFAQLATPGKHEQAETERKADGR